MTNFAINSIKKAGHFAEKHVVSFYEHIVCLIHEMSPWIKKRNFQKPLGQNFRSKPDW